MSSAPELLSKLDSLLPDKLKDYDAFPKLPSAYKARSQSRGFLTVFIALITALLLLNDFSEYVYGWTDFEFGVDTDAVVTGPQSGRASRQGDKSNWMNVNVDMVVNMPCRYLSVDLRDAIGDRMYLSTGGLRRDGVFFDVGAATKLKEHSKALSAQQAITQSRKSRGFFDFIRGYKPEFKPTYEHQKNSKGGACRIYGNLLTKKVTANLHVTTLGHGYASREHVDHNMMNLSHVITEFSFGSFFPEISQPLDNTFEVAAADSPFIAYQYFLHVVPTTYVSPASTWLALLNPLSYFGRSYETLRTNQYAVTHYNRKMEHGEGTPGIFFKFDLDPMRISVIQRTTTYLQLLIRCVGVIGGVFTCISYALRVGNKAVEMVAGPSAEEDLATAASSSVHVGHKASWGKNELRARGKMVRQGGSWVMEGGESPYLPSPYLGGAAASPYGASSPYMGSTTPAGSPFMHQQQAASSPYLATPGSLTNSAVFPPTPNPGTPNFGPTSSNYALPPTVSRTPSLGAPASQPGTPGLYASYPGPSGPAAIGLGAPPAARKPDVRKDD